MTEIITWVSSFRTIGPYNTSELELKFPDGSFWDVRLMSSKTACCRTKLHSDWSSRMLNAAPHGPPTMCWHWVVMVIRPDSVIVKATAIPIPAARTFRKRAPKDIFTPNLTQSLFCQLKQTQTQCHNQKEKSPRSLCSSTMVSASASRTLQPCRVSPVGCVTSFSANPKQNVSDKVKQ